jgi:putative FmdB family regulatory protein
VASAALIHINRDMIYEFNCEHCNGNFESNLPMADCQKPLSEPCPLCGKSGKIFRVYGGANFQTNNYLHLSPIMV